jgi:hypothetical protein
MGVSRTYKVLAAEATKSRARFAGAVFESDAALAGWLGVNRSQLTRYKQGQRPRGTTGWRLVGLEAVLAALAEVFEPAAVPDWLWGINAHLNHQRPIDVLHQGRVAEVMAAVEAERSGSFA